MNQPEKMITNGEGWKRSGLSSLVTALLTAGSLISYWQVNPPRPDPFTGHEANELRRELDQKIIQLSAGQQDLWRVVQTLPPERWQRRIEEIELWIVRQDNSYHPPK